MNSIYLKFGDVTIGGSPTCSDHHYVKKIIFSLDYCFLSMFSIFGDSVELPKWLNTVSGTKKSAKSNPSCLVEGTLSIGCHWGFECSKC